MLGCILNEIIYELEKFGGRTICRKNKFSIEIYV